MTAPAPIGISQGYRFASINNRLSSQCVPAHCNYQDERETGHIFQQALTSTKSIHPDRFQPVTTRLPQLPKIALVHLRLPVTTPYYPAAPRPPIRPACQVGAGPEEPVPLSGGPSFRAARSRINMQLAARHGRPAAQSRPGSVYLRGHRRPANRHSSPTMPRSSPLRRRTTRHGLPRWTIPPTG